MSDMSEPLWQSTPERVAAANLTAFIARANEEWGLDIGSYDALYDWSTSEIDKFWTTVWNFCDVIAETRGDVALTGADRMPGAHFFPDARLNFAENLLRGGSPTAPEGGDALVFWARTRYAVASVTWSSAIASAG